MMKLGGYVHSTKISPEFDCQGQTKVKGQGHRGQKRKSAAFCPEVVLWGAVFVRHFWERSSTARSSTLVGKSAHAV